MFTDICQKEFGSRSESECEWVKIIVYPGKFLTILLLFWTRTMLEYLGVFLTV